MKPFTKKKDPLTLIHFTIVLILASNSNLLCPILVVESCNAIDKEALLDFKSRITNDPFNFVQSWDSKTDCCDSWLGVKCGSTRVESLDFRYTSSAKYMEGTGIKGNLPDWIPFLKTKHLDLSNNQITGKLPSHTGNFKRLVSLNLSNNDFTSTIPMEFKDITHLKILDLHSNKLSGSLGVIFDTVSETIDVSNNKFTGPLDIDIGNKPSMRNVTSLVLSNNPLGGTVPKSIGNMTNLKVLEMVSTQISGSIPLEMGNAKQLTKILLSNNKLTGSIPKEVLNLKNLQVFDVSCNKLCGEIPPHNMSIPASAFSHNAGLCGSPLHPC